VSGNASNSPGSEYDTAATPAPPPDDEPLACQVHYAAPPPMPRRSFLVWIASAALAVSGLFMGATVVQALMPPARSIDGKTKVGALAVAKVADLKVGKPVLADYGDDVLFLIKKSPSEVVVLSQTCPHVGCKLSFNEKTQQFDCPCHASSFTIDGKKLGGPAPRNMFGANFEIKDGAIVVSGVSA
jgi:nitrite reductase/ring-hydroxylating ferredoxin subunit